MTTAEHMDPLCAHRKRVATLRAQAALSGYEVCELADGSFLCCRWGMSSKPLADVAALEGFLRMVGVRVEPAAA